MSEPSTSPILPGIDWPDMFVNLQTAYAELTQTQFDLEHRALELAQARDLFDQTQETLTEGLFVADQTGRVTRVNGAAAALLQRHADDVIGQPLAEYWADATLPTTPWLILKNGTNGRFGPIETALLTPAGALVPVSLSCAVIRDVDGKITGVLAVARDIREMRLLQQQLVQSGKLAAVGELATGVAHELNQPLQIIRGYAQTVNDFYQPGDQIDEQLVNDLRKIVDGTTRMMRIIDHLRVFARREDAGFAPTQINDVVGNALLFVAQQLRNHNIEIVSELQPRLPNVLADPHQLEQVLLNLFSNARAAMASGGTLTIRTGRRGDQVMLVVQDVGVGMPEHVRDRIFEPFFTTKDVGEGTGLGLSISYNIIKKHGGEISVTSEVGTGTTFTIFLPSVNQGGST
jgi:PAS domain S-box-containing protein